MASVHFCHGFDICVKSAVRLIYCGCALLRSLCADCVLNVRVTFCQRMITHLNTLSLLSFERLKTMVRKIVPEMILFSLDWEGKRLWDVCVLLYMWPSMHKPTIHHKTSKSSFFHHPLTKLLLITTMFSQFPYDIFFSRYTTVCVLQFKMHISRNVHFRFRICTLFKKESLRFRRIHTKSVDQTSPEGS